MRATPSCRRATRPIRLAVLALGLALLSAPAIARQLVAYDFKGFVLLDTPPALADLERYQQRQFDPQVGASRAIGARHDVDEFSCPLAFQDAARANGSAPIAVPVVAFAGCPFDLPLIAPESWVELREPVTLSVTDIRDGVVKVSPGSLVPFVAEPGRLPFPVPTAIGVEWRFTKAGLRFTTPAGEFITGSSGGSITFTKRGARVRGFREVPRLANMVPASNGWASDTMRTVQQRLTRLGYQPGPVDGVWGSKTRDALVAFQRSAGIGSSGTLDARTLLELGI